MYFPSKKDTLLGLIVWVSILSIGLIYIYDEKSIGLYINGAIDTIGFLVVLLIIGFLLWIWFRTGYKIEDGLIKIKSGPLRSVVKIAAIRKVRATKNPLSAPALSLDRIEILYGRYDMTIISPKNKLGFIKALMNENPAIQIDKNLHN